MSRHASIVCEFCQTDMRKNLLAPHVKAKHAREVAQLMLEQWKESATCNMIQLMTHFTPSKRIWIHSKMYPGCFYLFGIKPMFFTDEEDHSSYVACEANMVAHGQFLEEISQAITLYDLMQIGKPLVFTCPEMIGLQKEVRDLTNEMKTKRAEYDDHLSLLKKEAADLRELLTLSMDESVTPYRVLQEQCATLRAQAVEARQKCSIWMEECEDLEEKLREEYLEKTKAQSNELLGLYEAIGKAREMNESLQSKFKRAVADGVEKERQKEIAEKEKKKADKEKEKVKKALKAKEAKKKLKKAQAIAKAELDSDDSDSDSDSDSDDD